MEKTVLKPALNKSRVLYYDVLNILASLGVVFLHCNGMVYNFSDSLGWYQALLVEVCLYWPVPVFFMLSGATLMGYRERYSTKNFLKKRFVRTVIPFVAWTLISAVSKKINPFEMGLDVFFNNCFNTSIENVYWFFIPLFSVYLSIPILSLIKDSRKTLWYLVGASFLLSSLLPPIFSYIGLSWNSGLNVSVAGGYIMFVVLGYLLATEDFDRKKRMVMYALGIFAVVLRYVMTVYLSLRDQMLNRTFFGYTDYYSVFLAVAVFVFVKNSRFIKKLESKQRMILLIAKISGCSFGVYLMHMIIIRYMNEFVPAFAGVTWRLLGPFVVYAVALMFTYLLKKCPILKHLVP